MKMTITQEDIRDFMRSANALGISYNYNAIKQLENKSFEIIPVKKNGNDSIEVNHVAVFRDIDID